MSSVVIIDFLNEIQRVQPVNQSLNEYFLDAADTWIRGLMVQEVVIIAMDSNVDEL